MRGVTWRLLSGYLPTSLERRNPVLERKRIDYQALVKQYFHVDSRDESQQDTFRQVNKIYSRFTLTQTLKIFMEIVFNL